MDRDAERVRNDVARRLMSTEKAREAYGVVLAAEGLQLDVRATRDLRASMKHSRKPLDLFDYGDRPATAM